MMEERDILQHLLQVEKAAAELVLSAQEEADKRIAESSQLLRSEYQSRYQKAAEKCDKQGLLDIQKAREACEEELSAYRRTLSSTTLDKKGFNTVCEELFFGAS